MPLPLRAQVYIRQRDAILRGVRRRRNRMSRRELEAMVWEHRAMDIVYRDPAEDWSPPDWTLPDGDCDDAIPF